MWIVSPENRITFSVHSDEFSIADSAANFLASIIAVACVLHFVYIVIVLFLAGCFVFRSSDFRSITIIGITVNATPLDFRRLFSVCAFDHIQHWEKYFWKYQRSEPVSIKTGSFKHCCDLSAAPYHSSSTVTTLLVLAARDYFV